MPSRDTASSPSRRGGTRLGDTLSSQPVNLRSDPQLPGLETFPFAVARSSGGSSSVFDNGLTLTATDWIRGGKLENLMTEPVHGRR